MSLPAATQASLAALLAQDPRLCRILDTVGPLPWRQREPGFAGLLAVLAGQQISLTAAAAIMGRVLALPGASEPAGFLSLSEEALRQAGFSRPKIAHGRALAEAFLRGELETEALAAMDDNEAKAALCRVPGLGPWSAEIYLLFSLQRQDIFPAGDVALQASYADFAQTPRRPSAAEMREQALAWAPWRSLAARLLWHWWRHLKGYPAGDLAPLPSSSPLP